MLTKNPNKWLRKAFFDALNNIEVNGEQIPCYDERVSGKKIPKYYILLSTQSKSEDKISKCGSVWDCDILLDIVTTYDSTSNPGSKMFAEDIEEAVIKAQNNIVIDSQFVINKRDLVSSDSVVTIGTTTNAFRQLIRYSYRIIEK